MNVLLTNTTCVVTLDPKERCKHEADFWLKLRDTLREQGHNVVRRVPEQEGVLTHAAWYIRMRDHSWHLRQQDEKDCAKQLNFRGMLTLARVSTEPVKEGG